MAERKAAAVGTIVWQDLTVEDAPAVRDFYAAVVGWRPENVNMGAYSDFTMTTPAGGVATAGVCHARGENAGLPAQWLMYVTVADLDESMRRCRERGGRVVHGPRGMGERRFCVIEDPAGALAALITP